MYVLTLTPEEAAKYYDINHDRSFRKIGFYVWTLNGEPEPEGLLEAGVYDDWLSKQDIKTVTRADLDGLELAENQELRVDAAVWVQRTPSPRQATSIALFSHEMAEPDYDYEVKYPYQPALILGFWNGEEIDRLINNLSIDRTVVFGEHNPGVVESS